MKFSIIIPTYNRKSMTEALIRQVLDEKITDSEILLVDDCSDDGTAEFISKNFPNVRVLINKGRRFVAHSRNRGIRESEGDILVFIDSDIIFEKGTLKNFLGNLGEGINFPKVIWANGEDMPRGTSSIFVISRNILSKFEDDFFDENMGIYTEDTDFFERAKLLKIKYIYNDEAIFIHGKKSNLEKNNFSDFHYYMAYRNNLYLSLKFMNLIEGYNYLNFLNRLAKNIGLIFSNIFSFQYKKAYLISNGILWNIKNIGKCLSSRKKIIKLIR